MRNKVVILCAAITILLVNSVIYLGWVPSDSMENTIDTKSLVIGNRLYRDIERGDIVICQSDEGYIIKRVVGMPNETIAFTSDSVYIDDKKYEESYLKEKPKYKDASAFFIEPTSYFLMGDNRNVSIDSRTFGSVNEDSIIAKLIVAIPFARN